MMEITILIRLMIVCDPWSLDYSIENCMCFFILSSFKLIFDKFCVMCG